MINEALDRIQNMTIQEDLPSAFNHQPFEEYPKEFCIPPTTHLVATIDDLTDMLDYNLENTEYMDEEGEPRSILTSPLIHLQRIYKF